MAKKLDSLYVVSARLDATVESHIALARKALRGGCKLFQLRDKEASDAELLKVGAIIRKLCSKHKALLIVDDRIAVAKKIRADGVHLGQLDASVKEARRKLGKGKIVGKSAHSLRQALRAAKEKPDYVSVGPINKTPTKPNYGAVGLKTLKAVRKAFDLQKIRIPVVAIGGITYSNMEKAFAAGTNCVAVVREASDARRKQADEETRGQLLWFFIAYPLIILQGVCSDG